MRIVTIKSDTATTIAIEREAGYVPVPPNEAASMVELIARWESLKPKLMALEQELIPKDAQLLAPIHNPGKIICIGKNYAKHAQEMGSEPPSLPIVFSKFNSAITGPDTEVKLPKISDKVDFEAELVVVIGKRGRHISRSDAMQHVFGYCCGNDISARDWQKEKPGGQWLLGKTFDSFAPLGPAIVTVDEFTDPTAFEVSLKLNGQLMQQSKTSHLIFPIDYLIAHLSQFVTLEPGDLIFTGTPEGVGAGRTPPIFLKHGDQLEVEISGIGILRNSVVSC